MRVYKISFYDDNPNAPRNRVKWCRTQADAKAAHADLVEKHQRFNVDPVAPVDVPTKHDELVQWLNAHASIGVVDES